MAGSFLSDEESPADVARPASRDSGLLLYEPYYGLAEKPFSLSPDPRFLYKSASHTPVFHDLLAAIRRREGLIVLTGEIGTGKTTLCRSVLAHLDRKTFTTFVPDPFVTREDLLKMLLVEFGVMSVDDIVRGRMRDASRPELSYPLYEFLRSLEPLDAFAVLIIDEAQNLALPLLEEIRILSDLEDGRKLLQVVLIGQPEFSAALKMPRMRQVEQRVSMHCELQPLSREGVYGYVAHRLSVAGAAVDRVHFTGDALDLVFETTGGVPRVINLLCDRTLQRGHDAKAAVLGVELVREAMRGLRLPAGEDRPRTKYAEALVEVSAPPASMTEFSEEPRQPETLPVAPTPAPVAQVAAPAVAPERSPVAVAPSRTDGLHALLTIPATPLPARTVPSRTSSRPVAPRAARLHPGRPEPARRPLARMWTLIALTLLGALTGMSLAIYWLWFGPRLAEQVAIPMAPPAAVHTGAPLPAVQPPALDPTAALAPSAKDPSPEALAAPLLRGWVVQVGAFSTPQRAAVLVGQLTATGIAASDAAASSAPDEPRLHIVFAGPYVSPSEAASALERIKAMPGLDGAIVRPAEALR